MSRWKQILIPTAVLVLLGCATTTPLVVSIDRPTIVGYFPPTTQEELDNDSGGLNEALAHIEFALEDIAKCLEPRNVTTRFELTKALTIKDESKIHRFKFRQDLVHDFGIIIATPGKAPIIVNTGAGPSSLIALGPQAAWKYFSEPKCKNFEE
jgi:hypothetical protein